MLLVWAGVHAGVRSWIREARLEPTDAGGDVAPPSICAVVPARNEEENIARCVRALLASEGVELHIVVVDDHSTDDTAGEVRRIVRETDRVELLQAPELPAGWAGKPHACVTGAAHRTMEWLAFVDADVRISERALCSLLARAGDRKLDLISAFGTWELVGFWERVAIPAIGWAVRGAADPRRVEQGETAFANGQLIVVRRLHYEAFEGHRACWNAVLDDVALAEASRTSGGRLGLVWAPWAFRVRLYRSLSEIRAGYRKNFLVGLGGSRWLALAGACGVFGFGVLPPIACLAAIAVWDPALTVLWGGVALLGVFYRFRLERLDGRSGALALVAPLGAAVLGLVLVESVLARRVAWKGRAFAHGLAEGRKE